MELSTSSAQERPSKPKSRLLDFNESDESLEEEDRLDTELSSLLLGKLSICNLRKGRGRGSFGSVGAKEEQFPRQEKA